MWSTQLVSQKSFSIVGDAWNTTISFVDCNNIFLCLVNTDSCEWDSITFSLYVKVCFVHIVQYIIYKEPYIALLMRLSASSNSSEVFPARTEEDLWRRWQIDTVFSTEFTWAERNRGLTNPRFRLAWPTSQIRAFSITFDSLFIVGRHLVCRSLNRPIWPGRHSIAR